MELRIVPGRVKNKSTLQIDDARLCFRNFRGAADTFTPEGSRRFSVIIPSEELAEALQNDVNEFGVGWNVKISAPREEGDAPFIHLPVKLKYTERSQPNVYLLSGNNRIKLTEETIGMLDDIDIASVDLDIRPYDDVARGMAFRSAYLQGMVVTQNIDRFTARFAEEEYPEE